MVRRRLKLDTRRLELDIEESGQKMAEKATMIDALDTIFEK